MRGGVRITSLVQVTGSTKDTRSVRVRTESGKMKEKRDRPCEKGSKNLPSERMK